MLKPKRKAARKFVARWVPNPTPAVLALVNGGKTMAKKKTTRSPKKAATRRPSKVTQALTRVTNMPKKRGTRRRRNAVGTGTIMEGVKLAGSGIVIGFVQPMVRSVIGGYLGTSVWGSAGVTLATGYALSYGSKLTRFTSAFQRPLELATWTIVATQLASAFVLPLLRPMGAGANPPLAGRWRQMGDLVTLPAGNFDPYYGSTPKIAGSTVAAEPAPNGGSKAAALKGLVTMNPMRNGASYYQTYGR